MGRGTFHFNEKQKDLILRMEVPQMIEIFSLTYDNVADFLYALKIQPRCVIIHPATFQLTGFDHDIKVGIHNNILSFIPAPLTTGVEEPQPLGLLNRWGTLPENYRILGIYISEHLNKDPFLFLDKPEKKKPKITIEQLFFEMSLGQIGQTPLQDILFAEILPPAKERALKKAIEKRKTRKQYTVGEIFAGMPLSRVGRLTISEFFGAEVFGKKKSKTSKV
jgi:hypothetical protein